MPIFRQQKRSSSYQGYTEGHPGRYASPPGPANPFERKSLAASLSTSVKSLFSKRISGIIAEPPLAHPRESMQRSPLEATAATAAVSTTTNTTHSKRQSTISHSAFVKHNVSAPVLGSTPECLHYDVPIRSDRYSQARARVLAETAKRLQKTTSPLPATPSSISTGKTLPFFPEESEYEARVSFDANTDIPYELSAVTRAGILRFVTDSRSSSSSSSSALSSHTASGRSRPISLLVESCSSGRSPTNTAIGPQRTLGRSRESLGVLSSPASFTESTRTTVPTLLSREENLGGHYEEHCSGQRYSVAMSQNLSRRFQTRLTHEYEQRIYCLHAHYSDVIERMESRARQDSERCRELEKEVSELRKTNASLSVRETEMANRLRHQGNKLAQSWSFGGGASSATISGAAASGLPKRLVEFVDFYQEEVQRLTKETNTAQEWVVTLAELVIGPKSEHQSWDEWLNSCLDTLQRRREQPQEDRWFRDLSMRNGRPVVGRKQE